MDSKIEMILRGRQEPCATDEGDQFFYQLVRIDGSAHFFEVRFRDGVRTALKYEDLEWVSYAPDRGIDMSFGFATVTIEGRGLAPTLYETIMLKRIAWVREADTEMQDNEANPLFISEIRVVSVDDEDEQSEEEGEQ